MKVTKEMVETVAAHLLVTTNETIIGLRDGLEDLLADVPERLPTPKGFDEFWHQMKRAEAAEARVAELEAKLSQVRAWADFFMPESVGEDDLWLILDGE